jgi:PAS domain S-box-containing protein
MITSVNRKSGMKAESENKKFRNPRSLNKKSIENIPEINSTFFENSLDAMMIGSQDGRIYAANPAACLMLDMDEENICKRGREGIVEQNPQLLEAVRKRKRSGSFFGELTFIRKDGTRFPVELSLSVFTLSDGREFTTLIIRDITERVKAQDKLRNSEEEYRNLFENSLMGISQVIVGGKFIRLNKAYAEMYGYPDSSTMMDEVSSNIKMLFSNLNDRKKVLEILDEYGFMIPTEFELNRRNGEKFWALVSARQVKDDAGKLLYLQAEHIDITGRKKLEKEMYSASLYARNLIEASLDPLITINAEGKITDVNLSTEKITGITRKKLIGSDFADYFSDPVKARKGYKKVFSEGVVKDYPLTIIHKNGKELDVLYNATLFKDEAGKVQGVFAAARDITELKKIEEELRKSKELLEKLNQHLLEVRENERNQIALNLHDDLGQKLTAINLDIAWLKRRMGVQSQPVREKFEDMSMMIKDTIESIKETSAFLRPAILFDLGLVPAINSQLSKFEKQTGIKCHLYCSPDEIVFDNQLSLILYRILQESLTNIARHSGAKTVEVNLRNLNNKGEMLITDDGIGIETGKVNSLKSMGIAGIKERVKSVLGKMTIIGEKGKGTRIKILIPLQKEKKYD